MGMQFDFGRHTFENRRESIILYDGEYMSGVLPHLFSGSSGQEKSIEMTKEYLAYLLVYFDNESHRRRFGLLERIAEVRQEMAIIPLQ